MPIVQTTAEPPSIRALWRDTLARVDVSDPRLSVRPHEQRSASPAEDGRRASSDNDPRESRRPSSGGIEPGLVDLDNMRSGRDRFVLGEMLGRGGMSVVLHAVQRSLSRGVAVKVARYDLDQRQRERFRAESKLTAWLEHPNITPVYEAGRNYLVMRRIAGSDLERRLADGGLSLSQAVEVLIRACDAVSYAHHRGIIHRDIKPENILVGEFGEVMLIDWGLALTWVAPMDGILRAPLISDGASLCAGTPGYMAPEMAYGDQHRIGPATDVFLLGATLYRVLGGEIPFAAQDAWAALERSSRNDWRPLAAGWAPRRLVALQEGAMATDPLARPSLAEFQAGLREWLMRSRSEAEAQLALAEARGHFKAAQSARLRPHDAYHDYAACIAACDRATALNPDLGDTGSVRSTALAAFALAAVGAGELQLARLIKDNRRLPVLPVLPATSGSRAVTGLHADEADAAMIRRLGALVPHGADSHAETVRTLLQELLARQRQCERLEAENADLHTAYDALSRERDGLATSAEALLARRRIRRRRLITLAVAVLLAAVVVCVVR